MPLKINKMTEVKQKSISIIKLINQMNKTIKYKDFSHPFFPALQCSRGSAEHWKARSGGRGDGGDGLLVLTKIEEPIVYWGEAGLDRRTFPS